MRRTIIATLFLVAAACSSKKPTETPKPKPEPVSTAGTPCDQEVALTCATGTADGCTGAKTTVHVCVADAAAAGPECAQEIALECPEGQKDACLSTPAASDKHICVVSP